MNFVELMTGGPVPARVSPPRNRQAAARDNTRGVSEFGRVLENTMFRTPAGRQFAGYTECAQYKD